MSRQTQINTFNDGLNKDLNPLLTPNTVMTDCLNGTIVTYNGNEFALQNDLGNYKFKHGSLNNGFVPVGIKEHANILYIVSYNPIEDKVEIGSFPSMKTIYGSEINTNGESSVIELTKGKSYHLYKDLAPQSQLTLMSPMTDDYKLYPGDLYRAEKRASSNDGSYVYDDSIKAEKDNEIWQHTGTYILTENKNLYNIDAYIKWDVNQNTYNINDFNYVKWDVPGWLAVKPIINVMDEFNCYVDNISVSYNESNSYATIKIQSIWPTNIYNNGLKDVLKYKYHLSNDSYKLEEIYDDWDSSQDKSKWVVLDSKGKYEYNKVVVYNDIYTVVQSSFDVEIGNDKIKINVVPYLSLSDYDSEYVENTDIIYDQFYTQVSIDVKEWSSDGISIGSDIFKYYIDEYIGVNDSCEMTLSIDINAPYNTNLHYSFYRYEKDDNVSKLVEIKNGDIDDVVINGQNILPFKFNSDENFNKEDYYKMVLYAYPDGFELPSDHTFESYYNLDNKKVNIYKQEFDIFASEYSNYYYKLFDNYKSNEFVLNEDSFIEAVIRKIKIENIISNNNDTKSIIIVNNNEVDISDLESVLNSEFYDKISTVSTDKSVYNDPFNVYFGTRYYFNNNVVQNGKNINIIYPKDQNGNTGRLWENAGSANNVSIKYIDSENNYENLKFDEVENKYYVDILSSSSINITTTYIDKIYPESESNSVSMHEGNSFIKKHGDYYSFSGAFVRKDRGRKDFGCGVYFGKTSSEGETKIKIDDDKITLCVPNGTCTEFEYNNGVWDTPEYGPSLWIENSKLSYWAEDDGTKAGENPKCRPIINNRLNTPAFICFLNDVDKNKSKYFDYNSVDNSGFNCGYSEPYMLKCVDNDGQNRYFHAIAVSGGENNDDFYIIMPKHLSYPEREGSNAIESAFKKFTHKLFWEQFFTYLIMSKYVKWCKSNETNRYYIPYLNVNTSLHRGLEFNNIDYFFNIDYKYSPNELLFTNINNKRFESSIEHTVKFNDISNIGIEYILETMNADKNIYIKNNTNLDFEEVRANSMYIDRSYKGELNDVLKNIANMLEYKNGYFKVRDLDTSYELRMRQAGDSKFHRICYVNKSYYEN